MRSKGTIGRQTATSDPEDHRKAPFAANPPKPPQSSHSELNKIFILFNFVRTREGLPCLGSCGQYTTAVRIWEVLLWLRLPNLTDKTEQNSGCCSKLRRKGIPRYRQQPRKRQRTDTRHLTKRSARLVSLAHHPFPIQFWLYSLVIDTTHLILYNGKEPEG